MKLPSLDTLGLNPGILTEAVPGEDRLVLWRPAGEADGCRLWERISTVPGEIRAAAPGIYTAPAVLVSVRQQARGRLGHLWQRLWDSESERTWTLPTGETAEQHGDKQTELLLVWAEPTAALPESILHGTWPNAKRRQLLGKHLALVAGVTAAISPSPPPVVAARDHEGPTTHTEDTPVAMALASLDVARRNGDHRLEATALVDVGLARLDGGDVAKARESFQEALMLAVSMGDGPIEGDACSGLGTVALLSGHSREALPFFERELSVTRQAQNRVAEKVALAHLGICHSALRSPGPAFTAFEQALALAREVGDRVHEAELLGHLAVLDAELGRTAEAIHRGQAAITAMQPCRWKKQNSWRAT